MSFEARWLEVKRIFFSKKADSLKVLHLSDIHIHRLEVDYKKIKSAIDSENPDIIIMSGDYIEKPGHVEKFLEFLDYIRGTHKIYFCFGNHDYEAFEKNDKLLEEFAERIEKRGIEILHNRSACIEKNSKKYNIIGIADIRYSHHDIGQALEDRCIDAVANIAFSHNPDVVLEIPEGKVDYLFCGHFHGGQIWAPFDLEFKLLRDEKLCKLGIKRGLHKINGMNLYISKGLGNVCFPLRFMSRPEITVFYMP